MVSPKDHNNPPPLPEILAENYAALFAEVEAIAVRATSAPKKVKNAADVEAVGVIIKDAKALAKKIEGARVLEKEPHLTANKQIDGTFKPPTDRLGNIATVLNDRATEYQRALLAEQRRKDEEIARKAREAEQAAIEKARKAEEEGRAAVASRAETRAEIEADKAADAERRAEASNADIARQRMASGGTAGVRTTQKVRITAIAELNLGPLGPYIDREAVQKAANAWLRVTKGAETMAGLEVFDDVQANFR